MYRCTLILIGLFAVALSASAGEVLYNGGPSGNAAPAARPASTKWIAVTDKRSGYSVSYPGNWAMVQKAGAFPSPACAALRISVVFNSPRENAQDWYREGVLLTVYELSHQMSSKEFAMAFTEELKEKDKQFTPQNFKKMTINGASCYWYFYTIPSQPESVRSGWYFLAHGTKGYLFLLGGPSSSYERYKTTYEKMIGSFHMITPK